jgi:tetratricopeptide (TPR) repeat protein
LGDAREQARALTSLGRARHARGEYQTALSAHQEALTILESLNDRWRIVQALNDIGECHQSLYDTVNAYSYHERALRLANEYSADVIKPDIQRNLGIDLVEQGSFDEGLAYLQSALNGSRRIGYRDQEALVLYALARAYLRRSFVDQAEQAVALLNDVAEELDADRFRALAAFARGELLFHQGQQQEAIVELNGAMLAAQASVDRGVLWKLHATMAHVIDNENIAAVHLDIALEFIRQTAEPIKDPNLKACFVNAPPVLAVLHAAGVDPDKL